MGQPEALEARAEVAFYRGLVTISQRAGMLKTYELLTRHFGGTVFHAPRSSETLRIPPRSCPALAGDRECGIDLLSERSISARDGATGRIARSPKGADTGASGRSGPVAALGPSRAFDALPDPAPEQIHILSPFDPLIIQRKRLRLFFDYEYRFEAYVPKHKRVFGISFALFSLGIGSLPLSTSRPTDSGNNCWYSAGTGSGGQLPTLIRSGWKPRCMRSSHFSCMSELDERTPAGVKDVIFPQASAHRGAHGWVAHFTSCDSSVRLHHGRSRAIARRRR